jgi:hypothetical protein
MFALSAAPPPRQCPARYGAYDPDTGDAPVHDLSGLLNIAD